MVAWPLMRGLVPDVVCATIFQVLRLLVYTMHVVFASPGVFDQSGFVFFKVCVELLSPIRSDCVEDYPWVDATIVRLQLTQ